MATLETRRQAGRSRWPPDSPRVCILIRHLAPPQGGKLGEVIRDLCGLILRHVRFLGEHRRLALTPRCLICRGSPCRNHYVLPGVAQSPCQLHADWSRLRPRSARGIPLAVVHNEVSSVRTTALLKSENHLARTGRSFELTVDRDRRLVNVMADKPRSPMPLTTGSGGASFVVPFTALILAI